MYLGLSSMYKTPQTTANQGFNELESKYKVAEILSSMPASSGFNQTVIGTPYTTTSGSGFTPILTPTTLANIEQTFINLQQPTSSASNLNRESGFVPPVVVNEPQMPVMVQVKSEVDYDTDYSESVGSESEYGGPAAKRGRYSEKAKLNIPDIDPTTYLVANSRRPTGPRKMKKDEKLTPEEEEKRRQRRERNKLAAAKCRKRREDVTNTLIVETETLEEEKNQLETEILRLRQQKEQFEFLLDAHKNTCQHKHQHHQPLNLAPPKTTATMTSMGATGTGMAPSRVYASSGIISTARPTTLPIAHSNASIAAVTEALGIPITTPSTGMFVGFDTMAEGHTGLTPLTGIASSSIATPTSQSCSGQVQTAQRRSTDSSSSNELSSPTTLMAL